MFNIIGSKTYTCNSAWDIVNAVSTLTGDEAEAFSSWKKAGHLKIGETLTMDAYSIQRVR